LRVSRESVFRIIVALATLVILMKMIMFQNVADSEYTSGLVVRFIKFVTETLYSITDFSSLNINIVPSK
jgi:hypothetical protein